jgi:hypothetical protein
VGDEQGRSPVSAACPTPTVRVSSSGARYLSSLSYRSMMRVKRSHRRRIAALAKYTRNPSWKPRIVDTVVCRLSISALLHGIAHTLQRIRCRLEQG